MTDRWKTLLEGGSFFEGPRWHDGRWWVSDFYRHTVYAVSTDGSAEAVLEVEGQPSGLGWLPDDSLLAVSMRDQRLLRRAPDGTVTVHAELAGLVVDKVNDMVVDGQGRAWVGSFGFDFMGGGKFQPSVLVRVDPDGRTEVVAEDLRFPNGSVVTADGGTLIVGESYASRYTAFTITDEGQLTDRRVWASFDRVDGRPTVAPDGCCLDRAGYVWVADALGFRCIRVAEGGAVVDEIAGPDGLGIIACMLGGDDGRTLLACASPDADEQRRATSREAVLLTTTVDVPHGGWP